MAKQKPKYLEILLQDKDEKKKAEARSTFQMSQSTLQQAIIRKEGEVARKNIEANDHLTSNPPEFDEFLRVDNAKEVLEIEIEKLKKVMKEYFGVEYKPMEFPED